MQSLGFWKRSCQRNRGGLQQLLILVLIGFWTAALVVMPGPPAAQAVDFSILDVGSSPQTQTKDIPKGCPGVNTVMTKATVTLGPVAMDTAGTGTNISNAQGLLVVNLINHEVLKLEVPGMPGTNSIIGAPPTEQTGQNSAECPGPALACTPPGPGISPAGSWTWSLPVNGVATITPPFETKEIAIVQSFTAPGDLAFFKATLPADTFPAGLTAQGTRTLTTPATFADNIVTNATATVTVLYECNDLSKGLECQKKTFSTDTLPPPGGTVKATVAIKNTGTLAANDLIIKSVMSNSAKMTIVPGSSTIGNPTESPAGTWTFPTQSLAGGATLTFSYDVKIINMVAGDELCNQATVSSVILGITSDGPLCRDCITTTPTVPALGTVGASVALAMVTMGGLMLYRQRRKRV